jgi:hypothetical protein
MGNWTPSLVPSGDTETVYLVLDDFGELGRCWREADIETAADLETVIGDLLKGEYTTTPACVTLIGAVEPPVMTISVIAPATMRSPSPVSVTS